MKKFVSLFLVFSVLALSGNMFAKKRGADIAIYKIGVGEKKPTMKGTPWETIIPDIRGELIAVKQNSLLLRERESGADVTVDIREIYSIKIVKKSEGLKFAIFGLVVGVGIPALAPGEEDSQYAGWKLMFMVGGGVLGALIGFLIGSAKGGDETIQIEGKSNSEIKEILEGLRKRARIRNYQ